LREGVRWDDGEPLTADDVAFTVRLIQSPDHQGTPPLRGGQPRSRAASCSWRLASAEPTLP
jgi:ABC-type transport system substrate-binding protein